MLERMSEKRSQIDTATKLRNLLRPFRNMEKNATPQLLEVRVDGVVHNDLDGTPVTYKFENRDGVFYATNHKGEEYMYLDLREELLPLFDKGDISFAPHQETENETQGAKVHDSISSEAPDVDADIHKDDSVRTHDTDDESALRSFQKDVLEVRPGLYTFALSLAGNTDAAEDLVQETCVKAFDKRHQFKAGTNLEAWLFTILRNTFLTGRRSPEHTRRVNNSEAHDYLAAAETVGNQESSQLLREVADRIGKLPKDQRMTLALIAQGYTYPEVADILNINEGTVKSRTSRARAKLREFLENVPSRKKRKDRGEQGNDGSQER